MAKKQFNSVDGYSVGPNASISIVDANGNVTANALSANGNVSFTGANVSLGNVSNLKITGGSSTYLLSTDGSGNLSWVSPTSQVAGAYVFTQSTPASTWVINHNLGYQYVNIQVIDSTGNSFTGRYNYPTITFNNTTHCTVTFDSAQAGYAAVTSGGGQVGPTGGSNTQVLFNDAGSANGVANFTYNKTTNTLSLGNALSVTGNANVGNLGTAQVLATANVTAPTLISNVATGTAPLTVTSTTRVSNLNVAYANVADFINVTAPGTGTGYMIFANATSGNVAEWVSSGITSNLANNSITATTFVGALSGAATTAGTVTTAAQPNITSVGTLTGLTVGNATANAVFGNGTITLNSGLITGNGNGLSSLQASNVTGTLPNAVTNNITNVGTITSGTWNSTFTAGLNANTLANIQGGNVSGAVASATSATNAAAVQTNASTATTVYPTFVTASTNANYALNTVSGISANLANNAITATTFVGALSGAATTAGTVTTNAQPNITSVGTLSSLSVTGNANTGNLGTTTLIATTGNITTINSGLLQNGNSNVTITANGNVTINAVGGARITATSTGANVTGTLGVSGNANVGNIGATNANITAMTATGNISANNLSTTNKITAGNGLQVTTGGASITGNVDVTGNINVTGNLNYSNVTDLVVGDPLIYIGANNTGDIVDLGVVASYNNGTYQHTGIARNYTNDIWTFFDGVVAEPTTVIDWANATYPTVKMGNLNTTGNANITGIANVTGNVVAGNISTGGILSVTGNANVGNLGTATAIITTGNITTINSGLLQNGNSNITITANANVTISAVGGARITATSTGANVTGTLGVSGNANVGNIGATRGVFTNIAGEGGNISNIQGGNVSGAVASATAATNASALLQNTSTATTVYPTFTTSSANGNSSAVINTGISANLGNASITATTFVGALSGAATSATTAGTVTTAAQPNITSVGTLTGLTSNGNTTINVAAGNRVQIAASAPPTVDILNITNTGQGVTTAGVSGVQLTYVGGAAAIEASAYRTDLTPGGTTGGTWNGFRMVAASNAASGVTMNAIKVDNITGGAGTENMFYAGTGWDNILNYNGTSVIYGNGKVNGSEVVGTVPNATTADTVITAAQPNITSVGTLTSLTVSGNATVGNLIGPHANGNSNINIPAANGNVNISAVGNANVLVITGTGANITGTANVTGNLSAGNITTGTGTGGNISGANVITANTFIGALANGNSNVNIPAANGNVNISAVGTANVVVVTATGVNVSGTLNATGNANVGNLGTAQVSATANITANNIIANTFVIVGVATGISAAGTVQGNATALVESINVVSTVASGAGVKLPTAVAGMRITVLNTSANALLVYPNTNGIINSAAANAAYSQPAGARLDYISTTTTQWYTLNATYG